MSNGHAYVGGEAFRQWLEERQQNYKIIDRNLLFWYIFPFMLVYIMKASSLLQSCSSQRITYNLHVIVYCVYNICWAN